MNRLAGLIPSNEAIDFQYDGIFAKVLTDKVQEIKDGKGDVTDRIKNSALTEVILAHSGVNYRLKIHKNMTLAATTIPGITKGNPVLNSFRVGDWSEKDLQRLVKNKKGGIKGNVDLRKGKVDGVFSELDVELHLGTGLFSGSFLSADEIVAIILHEVGHVIMYCEMCTRTARTNYTIRAALETILPVKDKVKRVRLLNELEKDTGYDLKDKDALASSNTADTYMVTIYAGASEASRSELGESLYDLRGFEVLADQYAARQGLALPLVTGLDKLQRLHGHPTYTKPVYHVMRAILNFSIFVAGAIISAIAVPFAIPAYVIIAATALSTLPLTGEYDEPKRRALQVKAQLVDAIKKKDTPKEIEKQLLEDIEAIDKIIALTNDNMGVMQFVSSYISPWGRRERAQQDFQTALSDMLNNDLFVKAKQLQHA